MRSLTNFLLFIRKAEHTCYLTRDTPNAKGFKPCPTAEMCWQTLQQPRSTWAQGDDPRPHDKWFLVRIQVRNPESLPMTLTILIALVVLVTSVAASALLAPSGRFLERDAFRSQFRGPLEPVRLAPCHPSSSICISSLCSSVRSRATQCKANLPEPGVGNLSGRLLRIQIVRPTR
jgi:hypothetical protein